MDNIDTKPLGVNDDDGTSRKIAFQPTFEPLALATPPSMLETALTPPPVKMTPPSGLSSTKSTWATPQLRKITEGPITEAPRLPFNRTLSPFTTDFCPHSTASQVSARVANYLLGECDNASYEDPTREKSLLDADDGVLECTALLAGVPIEFDVSFYTPAKKDFAHGIIVEVHCTSGSSFAFHGFARTLLDAAKGLDVVSKIPSLVGFSPLPPSDDEDPVVGAKRRRASPEDEANSAVRKINPLLKNANNIEQCQLGLEMLLPLTDKKRMGTTLVQKVCEKLVSDLDDTSSLLRELVLAICADTEDTYVRKLAWTALANALGTAKSRHLAANMEEELPSLALIQLQQKTDVSTAKQAAKCVKAMKGVVHTGNMIEALKLAEKYISTA